MNHHLRTFLTLIAALCLLNGCATTRAESRYVMTKLFFGTAKPAGGSLSAKEWQTFLDTEITPRFPNGLTLLDSAGQYRSKTGQLVREKTKVLVLIHPRTQENKARVEAIRHRYKAQFNQEMVLKVTTPVQASF